MMQLSLIQMLQSMKRKSMQWKIRMFKILYSVRELKMMFSITNIQSDGYCGYRVLFILITYGNHLQQNIHQKFHFKDIANHEFFGNEQIQKMFFACLERLNTTDMYLKESYIKEVNEVLHEILF